MPELLPDEYNLKNHPHFLAPLMLKDGKMWMWYSICSAHQGHDTECGLCHAGSWNQIRRVRSQDEIARFGGDDSYADE